MPDALQLLPTSMCFCFLPHEEDCPWTFLALQRAESAWKFPSPFLGEGKAQGCEVPSGAPAGDQAETASAGFGGSNLLGFLAFSLVFPSLPP